MSMSNEKRKIEGKKIEILLAIFDGLLGEPNIMIIILKNNYNYWSVQSNSDKRLKP